MCLKDTYICVKRHDHRICMYSRDTYLYVKRPNTNTYLWVKRPKNTYLWVKTPTYEKRDLLNVKRHVCIRETLIYM